MTILFNEELHRRGWELDALTVYLGFLHFYVVLELTSCKPTNTSLEITIEQQHTIEQPLQASLSLIIRV